MDFYGILAAQNWQIWLKQGDNHWSKSNFCGIAAIYKQPPYLGVVFFKKFQGMCRCCESVANERHNCFTVEMGNLFYLYLPIRKLRLSYTPKT